MNKVGTVVREILSKVLGMLDGTETRSTGANGGAGTNQGQRGGGKGGRGGGGGGRGSGQGGRGGGR